MPSPVRVAGLGWHADDDRVTYIESMTDPDTLLGYDVIIWDLTATFPAETHNSEVSRRASEIEDHLGRGGSLVLLLGSDDENPHAALSFDVRLRTARGAHTEAVDDALRELDEWYGEWQHEAVILEPAARPLLRIPGTSHTIASAFVHSEGGAVLLMPPVETHSEHDTKLIDLILNAIGQVKAEADLPQWAEQFELLGEAQMHQSIAKADSAIARARASRQSAERSLRQLQRRKRLFAADGAALEAVTAAALAALGFVVAPGAVGEEDLVLELGRRRAVVEIKGAVKSAAGKHTSQLAKWVIDYELAHSRKAKGILIVNAWRKKPVTDRPAAFPNQMIGFAKRHDLCLLTGADLLAMWQSTETDPKAAARHARSLLSTAGVYASDELPSPFV
jgi:hypothetical protein